MRRTQLLILLILVAMTLVGCAGSLQIDMNTKIHNSAGKGDLVVSISGTDSVNKTLRDGDLSDYVSRVQEAGLSVRRYMDGDDALLELSGSFKSLAELNDLQADILAPLQLAPILESSSDPKFFSSERTYDVFFKPVATEYLESLETFAGGEAKSPETESLSDVTLTYHLTTPGEIVSSNAFEYNKKLATWTLSKGQMQSNISLGVLSRQVQYGRVAGATVIGGLLIFAAYKRWFSY